jgi:hypothetical protein
MSILKFLVFLSFIVLIFDNLEKIFVFFSILATKFYNDHISLINKIFLLAFTLTISKNKEQNVKGLFSLNELSKPAVYIILSEKI